MPALNNSIQVNEDALTEGSLEFIFVCVPNALRCKERKD